MSDSDDYDESSDEDYVPKAEDVSEEEESGEDEDLDPAAGDEGAASNGADGLTKKGKRKKNGETIKRQRKGGIKLEGEAEEDTEDDEEERKEKEEKDKIINEEVAKEMELMKEKEETKKIDDLWSSFLGDVKQKPKSAMASKSSACPSTSKPGCSGSLASLSKPVSLSLSSSSTKSTSSPPSEKKPEKVTITKIFDFAGEEVRVTKEVAADSKEAKEATKEQTSGDEKESPATSSPGAGISGVKRPAGGLGSVLGKIGKKTKISVLDKSKLDWDSFKQKEGIDEELKIHNRGKDGYIERKKFLEKVDYNQFEIERNLRLGKR
ncbi:craniofacial development protein 1-like isoform X2 [Lineus longissimus]|uniref:craniofacial development protein 1-like isoform X2 n=1 Tax=Lineus longissimus TaxID=88925 RepID=UPI00315C8240